MNDETVEKLRKGIEVQLEKHVFHQTVETNPTITGIVQCYLLLQILDKLEDIRINTIDIEHEISKLNPDYK
jgi:hypothetical protein